MKDFKVEVRYPRTNDWWSGYNGTASGRWGEISRWLEECVGPIGEWEYFSEYFVFKRESDAVLFKLKWL